MNARLKTFLRRTLRLLLLLGVIASVISALGHTGAFFGLWPAPAHGQDGLAATYALAALAIWQMREDVT